MGRHIVFAFALLLAIACGGRKKAAAPVVQRDRAFPQPTVPTAYTEPAERLEYLASHYWDGFFDGAGRTDSARVIRINPALGSGVTPGTTNPAG